MSYDFQIRSDDKYSRSVRYRVLAAFVAKLPKVRNSTFEDDDKQLFMSIDLEFLDTATGDSAEGQEEGRVNLICLEIPYGNLHNDGRDHEYFRNVARPIAEHLGWKLYDCQRDKYLRWARSSRTKNQRTTVTRKKRQRTKDQ